ncbi:MAG TPA: SDR family oxidoreductase [Planctomycetaceae bacterium]|nr:SDR family oxidoreductase [Planctomycetaceae bacterium]
MSEKILLIGASSAIAQELARKLCKRGCQLILAGRNDDELESIATDLRIRYQSTVHIEVFDALEFSGHKDFVQRCLDLFEQRLDGAIVCYGCMHAQEQAQTDWDLTNQMIQTNYASVVSLMNLLAEHFARWQSGYLAAISSVAGDRGRQSNYLYGSTKAALSTYLQGLRNRLYHVGVHVLTIKPGIVDTPMTDGLVNPDSFLVSSPQQVSRNIDRALRWRKNILYTPWKWWWIMCIIRWIPEQVFKRLKL